MNPEGRPLGCGPIVPEPQRGAVDTKALSRGATRPIVEAVPEVASAAVAPHVATEQRGQGVRERAAPLDNDGVRRRGPEARPARARVELALTEKERGEASRTDEGSRAVLAVELEEKAGSVPPRSTELARDDLGDSCDSEEDGSGTAGSPRDEDRGGTSRLLRILFKTNPSPNDETGAKPREVINEIYSAIIAREASFQLGNELLED
eukprot:CAMPEP_0194319100 /NCGR_PEP_ID=MMETSP0171-20130528/15605_1 /TAXON_ID=218684 /ORGANISM="Corethron pennatum, Strain L29A3" /LENGTH=206 /DNA_ID=CAMNT_0039076201 /DNA_START=193 /DNA_END=816 /DNA_ORIENTATION=+